MTKEPASPTLSNGKDYDRYKAFFSDAVTNPNTSVDPEIVDCCLVKNPYDDSDEEDGWIMADPAIAAAEPEHQQPARTMFVTIGSIASFKSLVEEVLSDKFLETIAALKFNRLIVQCGPDLELFERIRPQKGFDSHWIDISGFAYTDNIKSYILKCTPSNGGLLGEKRGRGIVMGHAGAGTILEVLDLNVRLIAVPNTSLMDNHQLELAEEYDKLGYLLQGHLGQLHKDVQRMEEFEPSNWPPKPPKESMFRHIGDAINWLHPRKDPSKVTEEEVRQLPLEEQMWRDMLANQPFPDGDPRHEFLNGHISEKKNEMWRAWRADWYAKKEMDDRLVAKREESADQAGEKQLD